MVDEQKLAKYSRHHERAEHAGHYAGVGTRCDQLSWLRW